MEADKLLTKDTNNIRTTTGTGTRETTTNVLISLTTISTTDQVNGQDMEDPTVTEILDTLQWFQDINSLTNNLMQEGDMGCSSTAAMVINSVTLTDQEVMANNTNLEDQDLKEEEEDSTAILINRTDINREDDDDYRTQIDQTINDIQVILGVHIMFLDVQILQRLMARCS